MPKRVFLGYDSPFLPLLTTYLLEEKKNLAEILIITPTGQSGRILRESLAAASTALLAPTVTTPGALLHMDNPAIAPAWLEKIAWIKVLNDISPDDWNKLSGVFPSPPPASDEARDWAISLATEITALRATLQDHLHNLFSASKFLKNTPEAERWENLATLETKTEMQLSQWGYTSRSNALRNDFKLPEGFSEIILAGITEMPPCLVSALEAHTGKVTCLIAAPESDSELFTSLGLPTGAWASHQFSYGNNTRIVADPVQQATAAIEAISRSGVSSAEVAIGSADEQTGAELTRALSEHGWLAFHPAAIQPLPALLRWLKVWQSWLTKASSRNLAALLALPESAALIGGKRAQKLQILNSLRDRNPIADPSTIAETIKDKNPDLASAITNLLTERERFLSEPFPHALRTHLTALQPKGEAAERTISQIQDFLEIADQIIQQVNRNNIFWLKILIAELPSHPAQPPAGRVIDVQGWLELLYEPGLHLTICGMNETFVPAKSGGEPWLSENIRTTLGLNTEADRHARDAYLLHAMLRMRAQKGSFQLICGKNSLAGDTYLPSRLLLQTPRQELAPTVENLFREIEPPESNLVWTRDFQWEPTATKPPEKIYVTAFSNYLACPFRFYLRHQAEMQIPAPDRREMDARDFGSITHNILEIWGNDEHARQISELDTLKKYFDEKIQSYIHQQFGEKPPLAIRIQAQALNQRLHWFAEEQIKILNDGWEVQDIERKISFKRNGITISGKIDRIDRHRETGQLRVIDYKTGKVKSTEGEHRQKIEKRTNIPSHLEQGGPAFQTLIDAKGKEYSTIWRNLQLPIYALAESKTASHEIPIPTYIQLGQTKNEVSIMPWNDFSEDDLQSAENCVDWVTRQISQQVFWPPAEKVKYDDFSLLSQNQHLQEAFPCPE